MKTLDWLIISPMMVAYHPVRRARGERGVSRTEHPVLRPHRDLTPHAHPNLDVPLEHGHGTPRERMCMCMYVRLELISSVRESLFTLSRYFKVFRCS